MSVLCCSVILVIDHLDLLKKDNAGAREAIRWLEAEFQKGNRFNLHVQFSSYFL
jgi:hypothetical protein